MEAVRVVKEPRGCKIDGCDRKHEARGWCQKHYFNWYATGNPLGNGNRTGPTPSLTAAQVAEVRRRVRQQFEAPNKVAADMGCAASTIRAALKPGYNPKDGT